MDASLLRSVHFCFEPGKKTNYRLHRVTLDINSIFEYYFPKNHSKMRYYENK